MSKAPRMTVQNASDKSLELLKLLTNSVRVMTVEQARMALGEPQLESVASRLRRLRTKGLLQLSVAWFSKPKLTDIPLFSWTPDHAPPDCVELAKTARRRWSANPVSELVAVATDEARNLYGTIALRAPRESELAHDLWVAELFLRRYHFHSVYSWVHEDGFGDLFPEGNKPDAALIRPEPDSNPIAIELLGNYRREKIGQFHNYCNEYSISYELW